MKEPQENCCHYRSVEEQAKEAIEEYGEVMAGCPAGDFNVSNCMRNMAIRNPLISITIKKNR